MGISAIMKLGERVARRNFLYVFAWLCATVVPILLQVVSGLIEEVRDYLAYYYSDISLFMFFVMTYGFASVFVSYYIVNGYRLPGTLDVLRISRVRPWEITTGIMFSIFKVLLPPLAVFTTGLGVYVFFFSKNSFLSDDSAVVLIGFALGIIINMIILAMIPCLGIFRRISLLALVGMVLVLPINALPVLLVFVLRWPFWLYGLAIVTLMASLYFVSIALVARAWPAQPNSVD